MLQIGGLIARAVMRQHGIVQLADTGKVDEGLALAKAQDVARRHPGAVVIGSDQVAALEHEVLDKPGNAERCRAQLGQLSGRRARFHTGCA